jgi:hypothetical protein
MLGISGLQELAMKATVAATCVVSELLVAVAELLKV